jgi:hypothetical protein
VTWTDFWDALQRNGAFPSAGFTLLIIGATFRWIEQVCQFLRRTGWGIDPFATTRDYIARHRAIGDERTARQAEERLRDQRRRLMRYGRAMMVVGVVVVVLSALLK